VVHPEIQVVSHPKNDETVFRMGTPVSGAAFFLSCINGEVGDAFCAEDAAIALDFFGRTHCFSEII
jgi:hypothetical protein